MSDTDSMETSAPRAGTGADLARRMDRMENRQDSMEQTLANLGATVARVETNQAHAEELNKLRFESQKQGLDTLTGTVGAFIARIDGIISGEIETAQSKQGLRIMTDYLAWRERVDTHIDESTVLHASQASQRQGMIFALSGAKATILLAAAIASPIVAIVVALIRSTQ